MSKQTENTAPTIAEKRDLGLQFFRQYQEQNTEESLEKAKKYLKEAADAGDEIGNQVYGILLYNEGNFDAFDYLIAALKLGNLHSAYALQENLHMKEDFPLARRVKEIIRQSVEEIVEEYEELSELDSNAEFVLALIGLYDLGERVGLGRKKGMEYLEKAVQKGNERAILMTKNPVLLKPETMNQFEMPSAKESKEQGKRKRGIWKMIPAILVVIAVYLFGKTIWRAVTAAATSVFHIISPILCIAFLLIIAYIAYGDEGAASAKEENEWDPMKEYKDNHDCRKMPNHIYDSNQNGWSKAWASENSAVYRSNDYGEDEITYCDISACSAVGRRGDYHWY